MTLAGGWKAWFLMLDANWTTGDIVSTDKGQVGDEPIQSFTFSPRFGTLISSGRFGTGGIWIGGMCLVATSEIKDHVDLSDHPVLADLRQRLFELLRSGRAKGKMERLNWWQLGNQSTVVDYRRGWWYPRSLSRHWSGDVAFLS